MNKLRNALHADEPLNYLDYFDLASRVSTVFQSIERTLLAHPSLKYDTETQRLVKQAQNILKDVHALSLDKAVAMAPPETFGKKKANGRPVKWLIPVPRTKR